MCPNNNNDLINILNKIDNNMNRMLRVNLISDGFKKNCKNALHYCNFCLIELDKNGNSERLKNIILQLSDWSEYCNSIVDQKL